MQRRTTKAFQMSIKYSIFSHRPFFIEHQSSHNANVPAQKAVSSHTAIDRWFEWIGPDRDTYNESSLWNPVTHCCLLLANVTLCCRMYLACKVHISQHLAIPGFPQSDHTVNKTSADAGSLCSEALQTSWPQVILNYQPPIYLDYRFT